MSKTKNVFYTWDEEPTLMVRYMPPIHEQPIELKEMLSPLSDEIKQRSLPKQVLVKIFKSILKDSDNIMGDLYELAKVCEEWRLLILNEPSLWAHIDLFNCPLTKENIKALDKILQIVPGVIDSVEEVTIGAYYPVEIDESIIPLFKKLIAAPNLKALVFNQWSSPFGKPFGKWFAKALNECEKLNHFSMNNSENIFNKDELFEEFLKKRGKQLEWLCVTTGYKTFASSITKYIESSLCSNLKNLNLCGCTAIKPFSLDAALLAENAPLLEVLHIGGLHFRMMSRPIKRYKLKYLKTLCAYTSDDLDQHQIIDLIGRRIGMNYDAVIETLTFGSTKITTLNLRGFVMTSKALLAIPSENVRELHLECIPETECSILRKVISRWSHSLEIIGLNQAEEFTSILKYLVTMYNTDCVSHLKEVHFTGSEIVPFDFIEFMERAHSLEYVAVSHCKLLEPFIDEPFGPAPWAADAMRSFNSSWTLVNAEIHVQTKACQLRELDLCVATLLVSTQSPSNLATNEQEINKQCVHLRDADSCFKNYTKKCLNPLQLEMVNFTTNSSFQLIDEYCTSGSQLRTNYLKHAQCLNQIKKKEQFSCIMDVQSTLELLAMNRVEDDTKRLKLGCCSYKKFETCMSKQVESKCGVKALEFITEIVRRITSRLPETMCRNHKLEDCKELLPKPGNFAKEAVNKSNVILSRILSVYSDL